MARIICFIAPLFLLLCWTSTTCANVRKRAVSNSLADVLGMKSSGPTKKKKPIQVTPPLRLKPGETAERPPGWTHCIKNIRATLNWRSIKSPGYPDFLESQIQCSWIIEAPIGMRVKLAFRDLDMIGTTGSCAKQFVQIIDVGTGKSQGRFCGNVRPGDYVTLGVNARIDLQADKAITKVRGFLLSFSAVKEIPGFRSSKTFPSMGKGGESAPGKVNVKSFASNSNQGKPKPSISPRTGNRRLVYESDRNSRATDPSATNDQEDSDNAFDSDNDYGWVGNGDQTQNGGQSSGNRNGNRRNSNMPVKVIPGRGRALPPRLRPTARAPNGQVLITFSTLPVRIRASPLPKSRAAANPENDHVQQVIYGREDQPHDPNDYTTLYPVRLDAGRFVDHRSQKLSTTNLMIIIACAVLFLVIIIGAGIFLWYLRKRQRKRMKVKGDTEKKKKELEDEKRERMELNVARLIGEDQTGRNMQQIRSNHLPGLSPNMGMMPPENAHTIENGRNLQLRDGHPSIDARRYDKHERGMGFDSRNGVSFKQNNRHADQRLNSGGLNTKSRPSRVFNIKDSRRRFNESQFRHVKGAEARSRNPSVEFIPLGDPVDYGSRLFDDHYHANHNFHPESNGERQRSPNAPRKSEIANQPARFRTLDPRQLGDTHVLPESLIVRSGKIGPRPRTNYFSRQHTTMPDLSRKYSRRGPQHFADEPDEDYCSGSDSESSKAPMRREYSPWELEQQKKDRKKKLITGRS